MTETSQMNDATYTKARFFKCALQVNPADYIQHRGQRQPLTEDEYNRQLLEAAREAGVEVIGMADHGSVEAVDRIRELFSEHGIVVFPGFEVRHRERRHRGLGGAPATTADSATRRPEPSGTETVPETVEVLSNNPLEAKTEATPHQQGSQCPQGHPT